MGCFQSATAHNGPAHGMNQRFEQNLRITSDSGAVESQPLSRLNRREYTASTAIARCASRRPDEIGIARQRVTTQPDPSAQDTASTNRSLAESPDASMAPLLGSIKPGADERILMARGRRRRKWSGTKRKPTQAGAENSLRRQPKRPAVPPYGRGVPLARRWPRPKPELRRPWPRSRHLPRSP